MYPFGTRPVIFDGHLESFDRPTRDLRARLLASAACLVAYLISWAVPAAALITIGGIDTPGSAVAVDVVDAIACVADGWDGLQIIDVSDPSNPALLGTFPTSEFAHDVAFVGNLAFLAADSSGLLIIDLSDPTQPSEVASIRFPYDNEARRVEVVDGIAYVLVDRELRIVDVSNPASLREIWSSYRESFRDLKVLDGLAYLVGGWPSVKIIDVSNPASPTEIGGLWVNGGVSESIDVAAGVAYVGASGTPRGLSIVDVSNPSAPSKLSYLSSIPSVFDIQVADGLAYLVYSSIGVGVIDVSNPLMPVPLGALETRGGANAVELIENLLYVATGHAGMRVIDVSNPTWLSVLSTTEVPRGGARDVAARNDLAFVAIGYTGLQIVDVADPSAPQIIGSIEERVDTDVEVSGSFVYGLDTRGLHVFDVSAPTAPVEVGFFEKTSSPDVEVVGDLAYLTGTFELSIVDVSDPSNPQKIGAFNVQGWGVDVDDGLAYYTTYDSLRIIDVSHPTFPVQIGALVGLTGGYIEVERGIAYIADGHDGLRLVDVSDPTAPSELSSIEFFDGLGNRVSARDVEMVNGVAYVMTATHSSSTLRAVDISNPRSLFELGGVRFDSYYSPRSALGNRLVYVTDGRYLRVVDFGPEYAGQLVVDLDIKPGSDPNSINLAKEGVIPAAILGSDTFDVAGVDATTLAFGPDGVAPAHCHGPHVEDVNGDGWSDLMAHFRTDGTGIKFGTLVACVSGQTLDGESFSGCDAVRTVPDMDGDRLLDTEEATLGTNALVSDTDGDGFGDGEEVLTLQTDPLDARDPAPMRTRRAGRRRR